MCWQGRKDTEHTFCISERMGATGVWLRLTLLALGLVSCLPARVTMTRMEVRAAMAKAKRIPESVTAWRDAHVQTVREVSQLEARELSDRELFKIESMGRFERLVSDVFGEAFGTAGERAHLVADRGESSPSFDPEHHVTHSFDDLIGVLGQQAAHAALLQHKEKLFHTRKLIREV